MTSFARLSALALAVTLVPAIALADFAAGEAAAERGDWQGAIDEWSASAEAGEVRSQFRLGALYFQGEVLARDNVRAAGLFAAAAEQGHTRAQYALAMMIDRGDGVDANPERAAKWYLAAAKGGHIEAQYNIALSYLRGLGVAQDDAQGARWLSAAAEQGYGPATVNLGIMHVLGKGVGRDMVAAYRWFEIATRLDVPGADQARARAGEALSPDEVALAVAEAEGWLAEH